MQHIRAHRALDRLTFYSTWFGCDADRLRFLNHSLSWPCWGDPAFTFCDVERALQREIQKRNYLGRYELKAAESLHAAEMAILERLQAKYRPAATSIPNGAQEHETLANDSSAILKNGGAPVQGCLF